LTLLRQQLERGIAEGSFRDGDPAQLAVAIWGACHGILQLAVSGGSSQSFLGYQVEELFDRTCEALLSGIVSPATTPLNDERRRSP
jgi:hypothetical protein